MAEKLMTQHVIRAVVLSVSIALLGFGCAETDGGSAGDPKGPGQLAGYEGPVSSPDDWGGGGDPYPQPRDVAVMPDDSAPPNCGPDCVQYCESLGLNNPVNQGVCPYLWGSGLEGRPIVIHEACRRLFVDMLGRFPTRDEVRTTCEGRPWGDVVKDLIETDEFVFVNQRRWADKLMYNNQSVSVTRIYDVDDLVGKLYRGEVAYDQFAQIVSAHPILTRRHDTPEDRADALFWMFLARPALGNERSDMARLYNQWTNFYYDHPQLDARLPDAFIRFACTTEDGRVDEASKGECTSILWGYRELIFTPDVRATLDEDGNPVLWSGLLRPEE